MNNSYIMVLESATKTFMVIVERRSFISTDNYVSAIIHVCFLLCFQH